MWQEILNELNIWGKKIVKQEDIEDKENKDTDVPNKKTKTKQADINKPLGSVQLTAKNIS